MANHRDRLPLGFFDLFSLWWSDAIEYLISFFLFVSCILVTMCFDCIDFSGGVFHGPLPLLSFNGADHSWSYSPRCRWRYRFLFDSRFIKTTRPRGQIIYQSISNRLQVWISLLSFSKFSANIGMDWCRVSNILLLWSGNRFPYRFGKLQSIQQQRL